MRRTKATRRELLGGALGLGLGALARGERPAPRADALAPRADALAIGVVGVGGRGAANLAAVAHEDVVALCDVDARTLAEAAARHPRAERFSDWRRMLERVRLDAVVVSTPDHTHAHVAAAALAAGAHVYCEKPLTHRVHEARALAELAARTGRATQMGTQIHASENYRRVVEAVRAGAAGRVHTVHAFCNKTWSAEGTPTGTHAVPESLDYDLWLGPVRAIPYHPDYHPGGWRRYWHFGGGTLADMGCHYLDLAFWALELRHPVAVEAHGPPAHPAAAPASLSVRWSFAALAGAGPLELWWHDGGRRPAALAELGLDDWQSGVLFLGDEGALVADYTRLRVVRNRGEWTAPAPSLAPSRGHHREWLAACRGGERPTCAFDYSGALTEAVLLGSVAHRLGRALEWDARALVARGSPEADALLRGDYRDGWALAR